MKFCKNMPYMYIIKVKSFEYVHICALAAGSIKENIEGDANLHHPSRNRIKSYSSIGKQRSHSTV